MVRAWVSCPLAGAEWAEADFLADAGAASTARHPGNAMVGFQLGADQVCAASTKAGTVPLPGVGGQAPYFETEAAVPFRHANGREIRFNGPICVGLHATGKEHFPSLLGLCCGGCG